VVALNDEKIRLSDMAIALRRHPVTLYYACVKAGIPLSRRDKRAVLSKSDAQRLRAFVERDGVPS